MTIGARHPHRDHAFDLEQLTVYARFAKDHNYARPTLHRQCELVKTVDSTEDLAAGGRDSTVELYV